MDPKSTTVASDLETAIAIVRRRGWIIVVSALLFGLAAFGFSKSQTKEYTASASLLFGTQNAVQQASGLTTPSQTDPQGQRDTNVALVQLTQGVASQTAARLGNKAISATDIDDAVSAQLQGSSNIVSVVATWDSPTVAARVANAYAAAFIAEQLQVDRRGIENAISLVRDQFAALPAAQKRGTEGQSLLDREQSLQILGAMQSNTRIVRAAEVPSVASAPNVRRTTFVGVLLGLLAGLSLALAVHRLDRKLREIKDVESLWDKPTLGLLSQGLAVNDSKSYDIEPFRVLRAQVHYFNVGRDIKLLLVSSAEPGEGKTTTACGLALAAASSGARTLLIEADLRRPRIGATLGAGPGSGLVSALIDHSDASRGEAIRHINIDGDRQVGQLDVLIAETTPPNPADLIESAEMSDLLSWARQSYDFVVVDSPPLGVVPDAIPLLEKVDGLLIVSRLGVSRRDTSDRLRDRLANLGAPLLGIVINGVKTDAAGYYGYSGASSYPTRDLSTTD